jgi:acetolactate synthase regulatory subunit
VNINLNINNENQDCKIGTVLRVIRRRGEGEGRRLR